MITGTAIGSNFKQSFPPVSVKSVRLNILDSTGGPAINEIRFNLSGPLPGRQPLFSISSSKTTGLRKSGENPSAGAVEVEDKPCRNIARRMDDEENFLRAVRGSKDLVGLNT